MLERFPNGLNRQGIPKSGDACFGWDGLRIVAAAMAISEDLRKRVVDLVAVEKLSRRAAAARMRVSIASAVRWVQEYNSSGLIGPKAMGGDQRSGAIEQNADYILRLVKRCPDMTLLELRERLINNGTGTFSTSALSRFFARHDLTVKKRLRTPRNKIAQT
jgi:transposase